MAMKLQDFRKQYPQYDDMSDSDLASAMHKRFYPDLPESAFYEQIGYAPSYVDRGVNAVTGVVKNIGRAIEGQQDPAYAAVPAYVASTPEQAEGQAKAKAVTFTDKGYGDILKEQLGSHFIRMEADANGYPVLVYKDAEGAERKGYVNKPGLDAQDVDRLLSQAVPFILGSSLAGRLARGFGTLGKGVAQFIGGAGTSLGDDVVAQGMGSTEGVDYKRAAVAGGAGVATQVLPSWATVPLIGGYLGSEAGETPEEKIAGGIMGVGTGLGARAGMRSLLPPAGAQHLDAEGRLMSPEARMAAERAGLKPEELDTQSAAAFAKGIDTMADPGEVAVATQTNKFGLPSTKGQRTKDPEQLMLEKGLRSGTEGAAAKAKMKEFDDEQKIQIMGSALQRPGVTPEPSFADRRAGVPGDPYREGMGALIAPTRGVYAPDQTAPGGFGAPIAEGMKGAREAGEKAIHQAWEGLTDLFPKEQAFAILGPALQKRLGQRKVDANLTPSASAMVKELDDFVAGKTPDPQSPLLGQPKQLSLDQMRRRLMEMKNAAQNGSDQGAAKAIYKAFDDWMDQLVDDTLVHGDPAMIARFRTAREITRDVKDAFAPTAAGAKTPEGRILTKLLDEHTTAESVVDELFGRSGPTATPKPGSIQALNRIKKVLLEGEPKSAGPLVDKETGLRTWNDIRMAYWSKLMVNKKGQMETPTMIVQNIDSAVRNQASLMKALFSPEELKVVKEYRNAMNELVFKDPNASGTATGLLALLRQRPAAEAIRTYFNTHRARATFSQHNFHMAQFYRLLAKYAPNIAGTPERAALTLAKKAVSQDLTPKQPTSSGWFGSLTGASSENDEPQRQNAP